METEIEFQKYQTRGPDYHYRQISRRNLLTFNAFVFARFAQHAELVVQHVRNNHAAGESLQVVDMGCGDGVLLYLLSRSLPDYDLQLWGVDLSDDALQVAERKIPAGTFQKASVYETGLPAKSFDIVVSSDVIEHVSEPHKMLEEAARLGRPGAFVCISTPIRITEEPRDSMHFKEYFPKEYSGLLRVHFEDVRVLQRFSLAGLLVYGWSIPIAGKAFPIARIGVNLLSFIGLNPFLRKSSSLNAYMYGLASIPSEQS